jgi:hypothetical protein
MDKINDVGLAAQDNDTFPTELLKSQLECGMIRYLCGCWENESIGIAEFCKYHDDLAAAEEEGVRK